MRFNNTKVICSALFLVSILLSACSGGGSSGGSGSSGASSTPAASTLSGTAAVGSPIVTGIINVSCVAGSALAPITTSNMGAWQVTLSGQTLPCAVQVTGGTINGVANTMLYHSIAIAPGTVNVTPFTDLMVANLAGTATPSIWFTGLSTTPTPLTAITQTQVDAALAKLRIALSGLTALSTINPITTAFTPTSGNISDDMLTALKTAQTNTGVTYASLLGNASVPAFAAPVTGFGIALTTAYTGTTGGATTGGTTSSNPGITGVFPTSAAPGATVTISGTNFAAGTTLLSGSNYRVSFNGTTVTPSARTLTQLAVIVPTGATTGTLTVTDLTTNRVYTVSGGFTVSATANINPSKFLGGNIQGNSLTLTGLTSTVASGFTSPGRITTDGIDIYIIDSGMVLKVSPSTGVVTTIFGACTATLCIATGITTDGTNLYVADTQGKVVAIVIATGVSSVLSTGGMNMRWEAMTTDGFNLYISGNSGIKKIAISATPVSSWGATSGLNTISWLQDMTTDGTNLYFINGNAIQKADIATGTITNLAGAVGVVGSADGVGGLARFILPRAIATDGLNLYATQSNGGVRKIEIATGNVTTISTVSAIGAATDGKVLFYASPALTLNKMQ